MTTILWAGLVKEVSRTPFLRTGSSIVSNVYTELSFLPAFGAILVVRRRRDGEFFAAKLQPLRQRDVVYYTDMRTHGVFIPDGKYLPMALAAQ